MQYYSIANGMIVGSRDSSVGIATSYRLDSRGLIPGKGTDSRKTLGPTQPPIQWVPTVIFLGVKWPESEADHSAF
jgi:hypothetical protein